MIPVPLLLRPAVPADDDFLRRLYAEVRAAEIALAGLDASTAAAFLAMQFDARQRHYLAAYPQACFDIVERAGEPIGRLSVHRTADEIRVIDIALLARCRGQGIGTLLLQSLFDEARRDGCPVTLQVEQHNPAGALYRRLGFIETDFQGFHRSMAWRASPAPSPVQNNA